MMEWHFSLQITGKEPSCPLCQRIVPWNYDRPEAVVGSEVAADESAVSDDDSLEFLMLLLDADNLLAMTPDVDAMLNDPSLRPC
jgi:hypothetical protein